MTESTIAVCCPTCGRRFRWAKQFAGKKIRCLCTSKFLMPASQPQGQATGVLMSAPIRGIDLPPMQAGASPIAERSSGGQGGKRKPEGKAPTAPAPRGGHGDAGVGADAPADEDLPLLSEESPAADDDLPVLGEETPEDLGPGSPSEGPAAAPEDDEPIVDLVPASKEVLPAAPAHETYDVADDVESPPPAPAPAPKAAPPVKPAPAAKPAKPAKAPHADPAPQAKAAEVPEVEASEEPAADDAAPDLPPLPPLAAGPKSAVARALEERDDEYKPSTFLEYTLPAILIVVGVLFTLGVWVFGLGHTPTLGLAAGGILVGLHLLLFTPLAIAAAVFTARAMDVGFGDAIPLGLKLAAISLTLASAADTAAFWVFHYEEFDWTFLVAAFAPYAILLLSAFMATFKLDLKEAFMMVALMGLPRLGLVVGLVALAPGLFKVKLT